MVTELKSPFPVYVGWDHREDIAYRICQFSLLRRATVPVSVTAIKQDELRQRKLYTRGKDPLASTQFTYTRFFVPQLQAFKGWALFCDCDFLWLADIKALLDLIDDRYAVMCIHHDHRPPEEWKMDNRKQTNYPRKNWSSMVLYNCGHPANAKLTADVVNSESGAFLHRFQWLDDDLIGALPETWNWLEGWSRKPATAHPNVVHFTRGGPWFDNWRDVDYADLWHAEEAAYRTEQGPQQRQIQSGY